MNLRVMEREDIDFISEYGNDLRCMGEYWPDEQRSKSDWVKMFDNLQLSPIDFKVFIIEKKDGTKIGDIHHGLNRPHRLMEIHYWLEAWHIIRDRETLDYDDYKEKYGLVEMNEVFVFFEMAGRLVKKRLIDIDLIPFAHGQVKATWEKMKPILEGSRKRFNEPRIGYGFEYLYNEMRKREQKGIKNG